MASLNVRAWLALAILALVMGLLVFVPAGTIDYWQAWLYFAAFFGGGALLTLYLMRRDPALLERRMSGGPTAEKRPAQRVIMTATSLCFIALIVVPAFDRRFGWSSVPAYAALTGDVLVAVGFYFIFLVYRENTFTAATIQVVADQTVVSTGPYAIVRHPMYASGLLYLLGTPIALGSYWGLLPFACLLPFLIWRLFDEEQLLGETLPGYREYQQKVRHRLLPGIW
jgi:protein-S-isoprenylcysteine O-methyltransferase Ste14